MEINHARQKWECKLVRERYMNCVKNTGYVLSIFHNSLHSFSVNRY